MHIPARRRTLTRGGGPVRFTACAALALLGAPAATGCGGSAPVEVRVSLGPATPLPDLVVTVLPFDPSALLDSLAAAAPRPRPTFPDLEQTLAAFRLQDDGGQPSPDQAVRALRDTVTGLADSLNRADRGGPGYAAAYGRFRQLYARLVQRSAEQDAELRATRRDELALARRARAAAESLRAWEADAYAPYPEIARATAERTGRTPRQAATDSTGALRLELGAGAWWLVARTPDPDNPFFEYHWTVPLRVAGLPVALPLSGRNATRHWRH